MSDNRQFECPKCRTVDIDSCHSMTCPVRKNESPIEAKTQEADNILIVLDLVSQTLGYSDYEELTCIEDGPANPDDILQVIRNSIPVFINQWQTEGWILSRERMPDVDGEYPVYGYMHHECGNVVPFQRVAICRFNKWIKVDGEQITYWRPPLAPPVNAPEAEIFNAPESHKTQESQTDLWNEIASILFDWPNFNMTDQYKEKLKSKFILTRRNP